jgi:hypothetical protein
VVDQPQEPENSDDGLNDAEDARCEEARGGSSDADGFEDSGSAFRLATVTFALLAHLGVNKAVIDLLCSFLG